MTGARISVDDREVLQALRRLERRAQDMHEVYADIGEHLLNRTRDRFDSEQSPEGEAWQPLTPRYQARKEENAGKILTASGDLRGTLRYQADADGVEIGSDRIYAATHQFGDDTRGIPARAFLGFNDEDRADVLAIIEEYLLSD